MQKKKVAMWKVAIVGAVALTGGGVLAAHAAKEFVPRAQVAMIVEGAQKELGLSDEQKVKVKAILGEAIPRGIAIHDDMKLDARTKRAKLGQLHEATRARLNEVLTPAQRKKASHWRENAQARMKETTERIADELKLTGAQRAELKPILDNGFARAKALRDDMNLTVAQKFVRLQEIRQSTRAKAGKVLTPGQCAQLDRIIEQMRGEVRRQMGLWREKNPRP